MEQVKGRLLGARITDDREPDPSVVDAFAQMAEDGSLKYLPWQKIVSSKQEAVEGKTSREWKPNKNGIVAERIVKEAPTQDVGHDLMKLEHTMVRRGVAMDVANLLRYEDHEVLMNKWFEALEDEPADADRYAKTSFAQISKADQEIFRMLSKDVKGPISCRPDGSYPLRDPLLAALSSARIQQILQPLLKNKDVAPQKSAEKTSSPDAGLAKTVQQLAAKVQNLQSTGQPNRDQGAGSPRGRGRGGGKARGRGKGEPRMPKELVGLAFSTKDGEPICYSFNLDGCSLAEAGKKCTKGWHVCMKKGCGKPHSQRDCH